MRHLIYSALEKRLMEKLDWLHYVDYFLNQYNDPENNKVRTTPAVFIEFAPVDWKQQGAKVQSGLQYVMIHLVNESYYDDKERILDTQVVNHFSKESQVFAVLAGFRASLSYLPQFAHLANTSEDVQIMETMTRINTNADHELEPFLVSIQVFATTVFDYSAIKDYSQTAEVDLNTEVMKANTIESPYTN